MRVKISGSVASIIGGGLRSLAANGGTQALQEGLTEGGDKVRTKVRQALKTQTNVNKYGTVVAHAPGKRSGFLYTISGTGKGLDIEEFPVRKSRSLGAWVRWSPKEHWRLQKRYAGRFGEMPDYDGGEVFAVPWGKGRTFARSFVKPDGKARAAIPSEGGKRKWTFRALYGPSMAKEVVKDQSLAAFEANVESAVIPAIMKRLQRLMK